MLEVFSWDMPGYIQKNGFTASGVGISKYEAEGIFQLDPEPPEMDSLNDYIIAAIQKHNLDYFSFFLYKYERQLNGRIYSFMRGNSYNKYDPERFLDIKLSCMEAILKRLPHYDPSKGAEFTTYIFPFVGDAMLAHRMGEEGWSMSSLSIYKNDRENLPQRQPFHITSRDEDGAEFGEDVSQDDSWDYAAIIYNDICAYAVQRSFKKLDYREQALLEKRNAICMACGKVSSLKNRSSFEELAVMFEGSGASGAERAYRKAVKKLTTLLVQDRVIRAVTLRRKSLKKYKNKNTAAIYEYLADCDGEWGEIHFDFSSGTAVISCLADWDTMTSNIFAKQVIAYIQSFADGKLPKEAMIAFEI